MANEIKSTQTGLFAAEAVSPLVHHTLADYTDLRALCRYYGSINGRGSTTIQVPTYTFANPMAATSESTDATNVALTSSSVDITVARQSLGREISDLFRMAGSPLSTEMIAEGIVQSASLRFTDLLCSLFSSVSSVVGTSGATLSVDTMYDAQEQLRESLVGLEDGPVFCVLKQKQVNQFAESLRGEMGVEANRSQTADPLILRAKGYVFSWNGIDFFASDSVTDDSTDFAGCMFGFGAFGYADGLPDDLIRSSNEFMLSAPDNAAVWIEAERRPGEGDYRLIGNYYVGISEIEDLRAVRIRSGV